MDKIFKKGGCAAILFQLVFISTAIHAKIKKTGDLNYVTSV
nr:MAG TPA: hypothetical protein [Caudoviricetes sp.]